MTRQVLVISNPTDEHTTRVVKKVEELGAQPLLFYPEAFGHAQCLTLKHCLTQQTTVTTLFIDGQEIDLSRVYSVWYRRPRLLAADPENISPEGLEFAREEWRAVLEATYSLLSSTLWVSHPDRLREAARKPCQLKLAHDLGFYTPRTLITNDPAELKRFYDTCYEHVIVKASGSGWVYTENEAELYYVLTNRLASDDLQANDEISTAPATYQEEIPKEYEIRANVVGRKVMAIKIDSQRSEISRIDWRRYDLENTPYTAYQLPARIAYMCLKLTQTLGLEFGAIDLIRRPDGEYVFLEINGNGQFLWAEDFSDVKVSDALASLLAGITPSLSSATLA